jgi:hypothetical protein
LPFSKNVVKNSVKERQPPYLPHIEDEHHANMTFDTTSCHFSAQSGIDLMSLFARFYRQLTALSTPKNVCAKKNS